MLRSWWLLIALSVYSFFNVPVAFASDCDISKSISDDDASVLIGTLQKTQTGTRIINEFLSIYKNFNTLDLRWDRASFSRVLPRTEKTFARIKQDSKSNNRKPASIFSPNMNMLASPQTIAQNRAPLGDKVCIHLTEQLPPIERLADLIHELTHVTFLSFEVLHGKVKDVEAFIAARLIGPGGEVHAFQTECEFKHDYLGEWDRFCSPYITNDHFDFEKAVEGFTSGTLSTSITGESYPDLLRKQFAGLRVAEK